MQKVLLFCFFFILYKSYSQSEGYAIHSDGFKTHYKTFGKGEPILIINGGPGMNCEGFSFLAQELSTNHQTIIYDQRGTGKSVLQTLDSKTITMQAMAEDIETLRKHLKIKKWIILGHSFGGMLANYYAANYPESISKMIFSASGGIDLGLRNYVASKINQNLSKTEQDSLAYYNAKIERGDTSKTTRLGRGRALAPAYLYHKKYIPILAERLTQGNAIINQLVWEDLERIKFNCKEKLKNFTAPVLIIQGKQDIISAETAAIAHQILPNSKVLFLDNCGHYGWLDAKENYFKAIQDFLQS